jgi:hypothetical protein
MRASYPMLDLQEFVSEPVITDHVSFGTMYNSELKVIVPAVDLKSVVDGCRLSPYIALYGCQRRDPSGSFEILRVGAKRTAARVPMRHPPTFCLALLAVSVTGKAELEALCKVWSGGGEGFLPTPTFVNVYGSPDAGAAIHRLLFDAATLAYGSSATRLVALQRQFTAFRIVHDQLQNAFDTVESYLTRAQLPPTWLAFACEPAETTIGPQIDGAVFRATQLLPVSSQGLAAIELHASAAGPDADGVLNISVASGEGRRALGHWGIPYELIPDGWMFLDLPEIDVAPAQSVLLTATWNTRRGLPPRLSLTRPQTVPESRVYIAGEVAEEDQSQRSLALRLHIGLPGSRRVAHPLHIGVMRQPHIRHWGRRLAPSVLRGFAQVDPVPNRKPLVRLVGDATAIELQPVNGGMTVAKLPGALPAKAQRLTATIKTEDPAGPLVEYALLALGPRGAYRQALAKGLLNRRQGGFSGWLPIHPDFVTQIHLKLSEPSEKPLDLYLATRLADGQTANSARARWFEFVVDGFCEPAAP